MVKADASAEEATGKHYNGKQCVVITSNNMTLDGNTGDGDECSHGEAALLDDAARWEALAAQMENDK
jgi:hypothetical protein